MYIEDVIRRRSLTFLLHLTDILEVQRITKYCALFIYEERFLSMLEGLTEEEGRLVLRTGDLRLYPSTLAGLQLLTLASFSVSAKIHESNCPSFVLLKLVAHKCITDQRYKKKDIAKAERILLQAIKHNLTPGPTVFSVFDDLLRTLREYEATGLGDCITIQACENILDLLYNLPSDCIDVLRLPKEIVAAAVLAVGYLLCVPVKKSDFPFLLWLLEAADVEWPEIELVVKVILCDVMGCALEEISTRKIIKSMEYEFMGSPVEEIITTRIFKCQKSEDIDDSLWMRRTGWIAGNEEVELQTRLYSNVIQYPRDCSINRD